MDTLTELRQLADDLTELGDNATAALVRQAIDRFSARKFAAGERLPERALSLAYRHRSGRRVNSSFLAPACAAGKPTLNHPSLPESGRNAASFLKPQRCSVLPSCKL